MDIAVILLLNPPDQDGTFFIDHGKILEKSIHFDHVKIRGMSLHGRMRGAAVVSRRNSGDALGLVIQSLLYLEAVGFAEFAAHYLSELTGVIAHFVVLMIVLIVSAAARKESRRGLWLALGLVPLIRIASLAMLHVEISDIYWYLLISVPVLVGVVTVMRALKYSFNEVGIRYSEPVVQALLVPFGIAVGVVDYAILRPDALDRDLSVESTLFPALILLISTGFVEELAFRGIMQTRGRSGPFLGLGLRSLLSTPSSR